MFAFGNTNGNDCDFSDDDENCYENYPNGVPKRTKTLPRRVDIDSDDDEFEDDGNYEELPDMDAGVEPIVDAPHRPPIGSACSSARGSASSFHRTSSSSASMTSGHSAASDDNDDAFSANNFSQGRRMCNGLPVSGGSRVVASGAGVRCHNSAGGMTIEDGLNTANIARIKSNLRTTASKVFEKPSNKEETGAGLVRELAQRHVNAGAASASSACAFEKRSAENSRSVNVVKPVSTNEVGSGLNSANIKAHISQLKPPSSKSDNNNNNKVTNVKLDPPDRDAQFTVSVAKKAPPAIPTAKKTSPSSGAQHPQPWHQTTNTPPACLSPPPPPCPISTTPSWAKESRTNPKQGGPRHNQPWSSGPRSVGSTDTPAKASAGRTQTRQPTQMAKTGHAIEPRMATGRSASVDPFVESVNDDTSGRAFQRKRILDNYDNVTGRTNGRIDVDLTTWQEPSSSLSSQSWYFGNLERDQCEKKLDRLINEDGSFVVRDSRRGGEENPYTLSIVFKRHVYHLNLRKRPDGKFSIGKSKPDEKVFNNVVEMITFHQNNTIELIGDSQRKTPSGKVTLKKSPTKR